MNSNNNVFKSETFKYNLQSITESISHNDNKSNQVITMTISCR